MLAIARIGHKSYRTAVIEFDWIGKAGLVERVTVTLADARPYWQPLKAKGFRVYSAAEFPPEPGEHCQFCPLRPDCQMDPQATVEEIDALFE